MTDPTIATHPQTSPWQLRWKRPELLNPDVSGATNGDGRADQPAGMTPISTASARLTSEWLRRDNIPSANDETANHRGKHDEDSDAILTVTILTNQSASNEMGHPTVGDAVLLEVTTICNTAPGPDPETSDPDTAATNGSHGNVKILHSKLLHWPSSALGGVEAVGVRTTRSGGAGSNKKKKQKRRYVRQERGVQSVALCRRARTLSCDGSTVGGGSSVVGDDITFTTLKTTASAYEQMSDALDTLNLLTLVVGDRPSAARSREAMDLASVPVQTAINDISDDRSYATNDEVESTNMIEIDTDGRLEGAPEEAKDLVVCFLSDSGVVHFFDPRELIFGDNAAKNMQERSAGLNDDQSFASLLFGGDLLSKIDTTIAPLSEPAQTVLISQFEQMPSIIEEEGEVSGDHEMTAIASEFKALPLFDCTMEPSTFQNVTVRNRPTTCTTAFGYVAIAGRGTRRIGRKRLRVSTDKASVISPHQGAAVSVDEGSEKEKSPITKVEQKKDIWELEYDYVPGGFVTFISLEHYAVSRTVFLSFEPKSIHPMVWNDAQFIVVLGKEDGASLLPNAVAICVDSRRHIRLAEKDPTPFRRFVPFAIDLSSTVPIEEGDERLAVSTAISVTSMLTSPPAIISAATAKDGSALMVYLHTITGIDFTEDLPIRSRVFDRQFAVVPLTAPLDKARPKLWCISGQGWSLLCIGEPGLSCAVYFITWEGATAHSGAHFVRMGGFPVTFPSDIVLSNVLPTTDSRRHIGDLVTGGMESLSDTHLRRNAPVKKALEEDHTTIESTTAAVLNCTELDIGKNHEEMLHQQFILGNIRFGTVSKDGDTLFLALRKLAVKHGRETTPCNYILSWLSRGTDDDGVDYYTAASIALTLLQDEDAVRDLSSRNFPQNNDVGEGDKRCLEGMLDGIVPAGQKTTDYAHSFSVESLADMAVACMVMGGAGMSTALEGFLGRNGDFDASRACLMLAATASSSIDFESDNEVTKILWPIRCLLKIAVARDCMQTALGLLNTSIPNALRCRATTSSFRSCKGVEKNTLSRSVLHLSKAIIAMILGSDPPLSAGCLLDLPEETPKECDDEIASMRYWQSLDHNTRIAFSIIAVENQHPLLRETEVRSWALDQIANFFESSLMQRDDPAHSDAATKKDGSLPSEWLMEMCLAILSNAGYCIEPSSAESADSDSHARTAAIVPYLEISSSGTGTSVPKSGGIDFNLLILALLCLDQRPLQLSDGSQILAHHLLLPVCDLAGLRSRREPDFAFDAAAAIKQCARAENVPAVAALIGGADGFLLQTANVLIQSLNLSMKQAELLLREGIFSGEALESGAEVNEKFTLSRGHKQVLSLFQEHVLSVRSLGQIDCDPVKGQIDPVFAARVLFRAWQALEQQRGKGSSSVENSPPWLETWLRTRLGMDNDGGCDNNKNGGPSPRLNRTACAAALSRVLLWPDEKLAQALGFTCHFLTTLAQLCCGVVESVPPKVLFEQQ